VFPMHKPVCMSHISTIGNSRVEHAIKSALTPDSAMRQLKCVVKSYGALLNICSIFVIFIYVLLGNQFIIFLSSFYADVRCL